MSNFMKVALILAACLANVADNITTYLCISQYPEVVYEANPIAELFFTHLGLEIGLLLETVVSSVMYVLIGANLWYPEQQFLGPIGRRNSSFWFLVVLTIVIAGVAGNNAWIYSCLVSGTH